MQRTVKFHIKIPAFEITHPQNPHVYPGIDEKVMLHFPFKWDNIEGTISISLDPDEYGWGAGFDEDGEEVIEFPVECGGVIVCVSGRSDNDFEPAEFLEIAHNLAVEYMGKFTAYLAVQLDQYWIHLGQLPYWNVSHFLLETKATWINEGNESRVLDKRPPFLPNMKEYSDFRSHFIPLDEERWNGFYLYLSDERFSAHDVAKSSMSNAKRYFDNGDYPLAAVQAVTALDLIVGPFVERLCQKKGISKNNLEEVDKKLFIADYLKVLLPLVLQNDKLDAWLKEKFVPAFESQTATQWTSIAVLEKCIALNRIRNKVAHQGKFEQSEIVPVRQGIEATELLLEFIEEHEEL